MKKLISIFIGLLGIINTVSAELAMSACPTIAVTGTNTSCYNVSDGSATISIISGGSGSYTHTWSNGTIKSGNTSTIDFLSAGTYTVTIKDNNTGCSVVGAYVVTEPNPISISGVVKNIDCFGSSTGGVSINLSGGMMPYSFSWKNSFGAIVSTNKDLTNVPSGTYTLSVNAPNASCSASQTFNINGPTEALSSSAALTNVDCFGNTTGKINVSVWGGTPPYAFLWDNGQTQAEISGLSAGSYSVTITDNKGCSIQETYNITEPDALSGAMAKVDVLCNGDATGVVGITVLGGTLPYHYSWKNAQSFLVANTASLNNVKANVYEVTVSDARGCKLVDQATILEPNKIQLSADIINVNCYGGTDGEINLNVSGGIGPFTYNWKNSLGNTFATTQDLTGVTAGVYTAEVTDDNGCMATLSATVNEPASPINVSVSVEPVLCFGNNTGAINLMVSGGASNFSYSWSSGQTSKDIDNILAGNYTYTVIDNNGCTNVGNVVITEPASPLAVSGIVNDVNCFGESNGGIDLTVTGGTPNYSFQWSSASFQLSNTNEDLVNYGADDYRFEVTDQNGCKVIDTLTINEPALLETSTMGTNILCNSDSTGTIDLSVTGGVFPYTYAWNNGGITEDLIQLAAGNYNVTVTDNQGCTSSIAHTLTEPADSLTYNLTVSDVLCNSGNEGSISLSVAGGTVPYSYSWSNGETTTAINNLSSGSYFFDVVDQNGCMISDTLIVNQPNALSLNEVITDVSCFELEDGKIDISPTGGTAPYDFKWFNSDYALATQTEDLELFPAETYQIEIVDANGCNYEMFLAIEEPELIQIEYVYEIASCNGSSDGVIDVEVSGGTPTYNYAWNNGATTQDLLSISSGVYELSLVDQNGCRDSLIVEITQPEAISMSFTTTEVSCKDQNDGTAYAIAKGGNGGYNFFWENNVNDAYNEGLSNQYYSVEVTDMLGCTFTDSVLIPINPITCIDPVNTFTPNNDNYNDTWIIDNIELYPNFKMQIFNKWGNLVRSMENEYSPWDGTTNGKLLPAGVYYWVLNLNDEENNVLNGNITIIR
ncbi:T9SS type B sorting domain-containing protein [Brumimicrobium oceani]|uniref:Ig-like domain-containing protein n=1 Tax=Brumimicrobium oceani TaxID=2100725 RepID=A0A2U2XFZ9_9FLAO|nr:gliding motility-associated C-terminal domain-containing protein [Brumimicrobium oceani]PWH86631.1 hypothetical protein DIT68_05200 [Brumimicrobium oceani]